jgi:hypothetical protein
MGENIKIKIKVIHDKIYRAYRIVEDKCFESKQLLRSPYNCYNCVHMKKYRRTKRTAYKCTIYNVTIINSLPDCPFHKNV